MRFSLFSYSSENFLRCVVNDSKFTDSETAGNKRHIRYFETYLDKLSAQTILIEHDYVDRDYLEDYAAYYDRCFTDYPRRTRRLHFFNLSFIEAEFESVVHSTPNSTIEKKFREAYLGFIVIKPLPLTMIGRTCLKTYGSDGGRRHFPSLRAYPVNLFGVELEVISLAFQEQDTVVAACATSALWTCLQGTGKLFQHNIPAPVEITSWAGDQLPENLLASGARAFPNAGLTAKQMAHAIKRVNLDPYIARAAIPSNLNRVAYAYLRGKIPSILSCQVINYQVINDHEERETSLGGHAVAITGFSLSDYADMPPESQDFILRADRINKLYVHDDQTGPFSRLEWSDLPTPAQMGREFQYRALKTTWSEKTYMVPDFVLLPLYHKIRIPYSLIHDAMDALAGAAAPLMNSNSEKNVNPITPATIEWDIFLTTVNDYKTSIRSEYADTGLDFSASLYVDLPRFLWRVIIRSDGLIDTDILFDATGIAQHDLLVHIFSTGRVYSNLLTLLSLPSQSDAVRKLPLQARAVIETYTAQ